MIGKDVLELYKAIDRWTCAVAFVEDDYSCDMHNLFNFRGAATKEQDEENLKNINKYLGRELRLTRFEEDEGTIIFYFYDDEGDPS